LFLAKEAIRRPAAVVGNDRRPLAFDLQSCPAEDRRRQALKTLITFAIGFGIGWAARSMVDSPRSLGAMLLRAVLIAKRRLGHWAAVERERLEDLMAEVRSTLDEEPIGGDAHERQVYPQ
jgi:hypothetical protein